MKIKCPNCGVKIEKDARFCIECGRAINGDESSREVYAGKRVKCPNCGDTLKAFSAFCPSCGFEIRGEKNLSAAKELMKQLNALNTKKEGLVGGIKKVFNKKAFLEQKAALISNYVVPNTREDILEAMILAVSNISVDAYNLVSNSLAERKKRENDRILNESWKSLYEQALDKAKILKLDESEVDEIVSTYKEKKRKIVHQKLKVVYILLGLIGALIGLIALLVLLGRSLE